MYIVILYIFDIKLSETNSFLLGVTLPFSTSCDFINIVGAVFLGLGMIAPFSLW